MERLTRYCLAALLALCLTGCIATGERKLAFVDTHGQAQVVEFSGEKPTISAHIHGQTLALQQLGGHQIVVVINHQSTPLRALRTHAISQLTLYEIAPAGFIDMFDVQHANLCQAYLAHKSMNVSHALSFGIRELQAVKQRPHFWGQWQLKDDTLAHSKPIYLQREQLSSAEATRLVVGSARKLASFLTYLCQP
ncbi:hypothetical protein HPC38_04260 [Pasteurellaceae bacterium HPA106]|uniref:hypothetical protein n=1 Tax=Spirabiliibacterium pneumoniae TaxID=221400 RepID=UPI001AACA558|nr:hypothetical protein [Spirabiliibacterium pneumoniae]MBE2896087.1 hypothetical protein [Spirabiliibacterium pneumoniae]